MGEGATAKRDNVLDKDVNRVEMMRICCVEKGNMGTWKERGRRDKDVKNGGGDS